MQKFTFYQIFFKSIYIKALPYSFKYNTQHFIVCLNQAGFLSVFLYMINHWIFLRVIVEINIIEEGLLLSCITHGKLGNAKMRTEAINLFLDCLLKTGHDQERDNTRSQPYGNSNNGNYIDDGRKTFLLLPADSFCDEVREVQKDWLKFGLSTLKIKYKWSGFLYY